MKIKSNNKIDEFDNKFNSNKTKKKEERTNLIQTLKL